MKCIVLQVLICLTLAQAFAADELPNPVRTELLADVGSVRPGEEFRLGVLFEIEPGWHVYWRNPGDSGLPTLTKFDLPDGFAVTELQWPIPTKFTRSGGIVDFGYEDTLLLTAVAKAPAHLKKESSVPIGAEVSWLSCQEVCIPGQVRLELMFSVGESSETKNAGLFAEWEKRLPVDPTRKSDPFIRNIEQVVDEGGKSSRYIVLLAWDSVPSGVEWFPAPESSLEIDNISLETKDNETRLSFDAKVLPGRELSSNVLDSVVAYRNARGERRGINLAVKLDE